ncbi:MAG: hypothetical protein ACJ75S_05190 [Solirubrobacterales bacterium]|jgi:hypothetical protein
MMRLHRNDPSPEPSSDHDEGVAEKLSRVRPIFHDEDERQSAADRETYHTPFESKLAPVALPRWLRPRKPKNLF